MKVLSIKEPHASLLLTPYKNIETRSWKTNYRGPILLHASKSFGSGPEIGTLIDLFKDAGLRKHFLAGFIYAKAELVDCKLMTEQNIEELKRENPMEILCGYYSPGRYMWILKNIEPINLIKIDGHLGLWNYEEE